jgi:uncharacterized protein
MPIVSASAAMISYWLQRDRARMDALAERLRRETGFRWTSLERTSPTRATSWKWSRDCAMTNRIGILVNNAGANAHGGFLDQSPDDVAKIINLNTTALKRLASAVVPRFVKAGAGAIINISSVVA